LHTAMEWPQGSVLQEWPSPVEVRDFATMAVAFRATF
jgi:hypothetical protein